MQSSKWIVLRVGSKILSYTFDGTHRHWWVDEKCFFRDKGAAYNELYA